MNCLHCKFGVRIKDVPSHRRKGLYYGIKLIFGLGGEIAIATDENIEETDYHFLECRKVEPKILKEYMIWPIVHRDDWCNFFHDKRDDPEAEQ